jgi:predicted Zn-dependent peptidase
MMRIYNLLNTIIIGSLALLATHANANYTLPEYQKVILDNGLTVYLMEQHEVPLIDVNIVVNAGAINDSIPGLAYLTAESLPLGTKQLSKAEINQTVDFIGANISASAGSESSSVESSFAKKDQEIMLKLLKDIITTPKFSADEFTKKKKQHLLALEQNKESPKSVINNYFKELIFTNSTYNAVTTGNTVSVNKIKLTDIKVFHKQWYQPQNAAIVIVGDFQNQKMLAQIKTLFADWQNNSNVKTAAIIPPKPLTQANVLLVNKEDAIESTFAIGGLGIARNTPDLVGISVINTILGARFTSWLNDELRVNSGLTYGARSNFTYYSQSGSFAISSFTKTATTVEAIDLALKTYQRLWEKGIDEATLASAKAYVKGKFPPKFETSQDLSSLLGQMYSYNFDESYINTFEQQVNSLTLAKTKQLINTYFPKDNLQTVIIGKASSLYDVVGKYGKVQQIDIKDINNK